MCPCARDSFAFAGGRRLLSGGAAPPAVLWAPRSSSSTGVEAQRAHLERVLSATTTVLFVASLSYVALSALYGCIQEGSRRRRRRERRDQSGGAASCVVEVEVEATKRALEEIPVHVVVAPPPRVDGGGVADVEAGEGEETAADDCCAVCLAEYAAGDEVRLLPACRHGFHRECVDRWLLTRAPTCPVCRAPVGRPVEEPDAKEDCATEHAGVGGTVAAGSTVVPAMWP